MDFQSLNPKPPAIVVLVGFMVVGRHLLVNFHPAHARWKSGKNRLSGILLEGRHAESKGPWALSSEPVMCSSFLSVLISLYASKIVRNLLQHDSRIHTIYS